MKHATTGAALGCLLALGSLPSAQAWDLESSFNDVVGSFRDKISGDSEKGAATSDSSAKQAKANSTRRIPNGDDMKKLQRLLNQLGEKGGYSAGTPDGQFGGKTRTAIRSFQNQQGLPVDGAPTYALLDRTRAATKSTGFSFGGLFPSGDDENRERGAGDVPDFSLTNCIQPGDYTSGRLMEAVYSKATDELPFDVGPYLAGFCMPESRHYLERLYLYLVAQGAAHARLTLVKYDALVDYYSKAGVDLGIQKDAFKRSIESLDSDLRSLAEDRREGTKRLLDNFESEQAREFLEAVPPGYEKLEAKYRKGARAIMAEALTHSVSSTFYLTRSGVIGKKLLAVAVDIVEDESSGNVFQVVVRKIREVTESAKIGVFIADKKDELYEMTLASTYTVKTFTEDIKEVPRLEPSHAERELEELREENGVSLEGFEAAFEDQQQEQLEKADV